MDVASREQPKRVSLTLAIGLLVISTALTFVAFFGRDHGLTNLPKIVKDPEFFQHYIMQAIGGSLGLPTINVLLASVFKFKRNSFTRRQIYIGWALMLIVLEAIAIIKL